MARVVNRRSFLIGMLTGAALAVAGAGTATLVSKKQSSQYLRVMDDNFDHTLAPNYRADDGPLSPRLIRNCKIERFVTDSALPDHTGSSFVKIDGTAKAKLNCLIGQARANSLSIALVDGIDTRPPPKL